MVRAAPLVLLCLASLLLTAVSVPAEDPMWKRGPRFLGGDLILHPFDARDVEPSPYPHTLNRGSLNFLGFLMHNELVPALHGEGYTMHGDPMSFIDLGWAPEFAPADAFTLFSCFLAERTGTLQALLGQTDLSTDARLLLGIAPDGRLVGEVRTAGLALNSVRSPLRVDDGQWHCAGFLREGDHLRLWLDGRTIAQAPLVAYDGVNIDIRLYTGCLAKGMMGVDCMVGIMDETRVYARALSHAEMARISVDPYASPLVAARVAADGTAPEASLRPEQGATLMADGTLAQGAAPAWFEIAGVGVGKAAGRVAAG